MPTKAEANESSDALMKAALTCAEKAAAETTPQYAATLAAAARDLAEAAAWAIAPAQPHGGSHSSPTS